MQKILSRTLISLASLLIPVNNVKVAKTDTSFSFFEAWALVKKMLLFIIIITKSLT